MFDKYEDVRATLDRQLVEREKPPSHVTAERQLAEAKIGFTRVVHADIDAILYVDEHGKAMTAWSEVRPAGPIVFYRQTGFPAWPSPYVKEAG